MALDSITLRGKRYILLEEVEYLELKSRPAFPRKAASGNYPAVPAARSMIAANIIRRRERQGLTQKALALKAGVRPEVLNRIERGVTTPSLRTVEKLENALKAR